MHWYRVLSVVAVAGRLAAFEDPVSANPGNPGSGREDAPVVAVARPPVLRGDEPRESVTFRLPGAAAKPAVSTAAPISPKPAAPDPAPARRVPAPSPRLQATAPAPAVGAPASAPRIPAPSLEAAPPAPGPAIPVARAPRIPAPSPSLQATALAPVTAISAARAPFPAPPKKAIPQGIPKPVLPAELERESALFCQRRITEWTQPDAYNLFGDPLRERTAFDDERKPNGTIYAYADPTGRYRELELDFDIETGVLRSVFAYPWKMNWQDCRRLWGAKVTSADADKGRTFYSYLNRRLDVLVDGAGRVISLGLY